MATEAILRSNKASALLNGLYNQGLEDMSYVTKRSLPNIAANDIIEVQPTQSVSTSFYNRTERFDIPKTSLLYGLVHRLAFDISGISVDSTDDIWNRPVGLDIPQTFELRTRSNNLVTIDGSAQRARSVSSYNMAKALGISRRSILLNQTTEKPAVATVTTVTTGDTTSVVVYLMPEFFFSEAIDQMLDTAYVEPVQYVVQYNDSALAGLLGGTISNVSSTIFTRFVTPEFSIYNALQAKNFGGGNNLQMLMYDTLSDVVACSSATSNTISVRINNPTFMMYISLVENIAARTAAANTFSPIQQYTFQINTRSYHEDVPVLVSDYYMESMGNSRTRMLNNFDVEYTEDGPVAVPFGLAPNDFTFNSGAVVFANTDSPQITVTTATLGTPANFNLVVDYFVWTLGIISENSRFIKSSST